MLFPLDGKIEDTKWDCIARRCLPASDHPDINQIGLEFVQYMHAYGLSIYHPSITTRFQYFCKNITTT